MDNEVHFNENKHTFEREREKRKMRGFGEKLANWIIKYSGGIIKNEKQAYLLILGIIILLFIVNFFLFSSVGEVNKPFYEEDIMSPDGIPIKIK